ncbi:expressed unknown protein [Seminavis robusta]|uniref:Uncharacterized protein n=1 Tax=Seminavis robusta TaxID=568900 RepID=A0A9N8EKU4_9STRA|nr:expressed unknown protein [Seminavis robusta]|eukprot:Sro1316_g262140.1 n/a (251) ;mRNA; f:15009-15884
MNTSSLIQGKRDGVNIGGSVFPQDVGQQQDDHQHRNMRNMKSSNTNNTNKKKNTLVVALSALGGVLAGDEGVAIDDEYCYKPSSDNDHPIRCVNDQSNQVTHVPCVSYTDHPAQPDWGCTDREPLCITSTGVDDSDALPGAFGIQCIEAPAVEQDIVSATSSKKMGLWGLMAPNKNTNNAQAFGMAQYNPNNATEDEFEITSLCNGCPLSNQGRDCESNKTCDTLGGVHMTSSTTQPTAATTTTTGVYAW